jgi:DNA-binding CsgD family transcriptional regulator
LTAPRLLGRELEASRIAVLIEQLPRRGSALVISGEPGIGKTSLLQLASTLAEDETLSVVRCAGVRCEAHLPFAGLHQLLRPILPAVSELSEIQRGPLYGAFSLDDSEVQDHFLVASAALDLIELVASRSPLLMLVEDAHWLDTPSSAALSFIARRIEAESAVMLIALRDGYETPFVQTGLPELTLEGLGPDAARTLLDANAPHLAPELREQLLAQSRGNPLALVELPLALRSGPRFRSPSVTTRLPLTSRLERAFVDRYHELAAPTRALLLLAAVDDGESLAEILASGSLLHGTELRLNSLMPAVGAKLVQIEREELHFRQPLLRSAILQATDLPQQQAAHSALAGLLASEPDRRAWHRAASIVGTNESVAAELEATSARAIRRGAPSMAVAALERAAQLSEHSPERSRRLVGAITTAFETGQRDVVERLLRELDVIEVSEGEEARLMSLRELFEEGLNGGTATIDHLLRTAGETATRGDGDLARRLVRAAATRCFWADPGTEVTARVVAATHQLQRSEFDAEAILALALADPVGQGPDVRDRLRRLPAGIAIDPATAHLLGTAATTVGAMSVGKELLGTAISGLRVQGRVGLLARALGSYTFSAVLCGDWSDGDSTAHEACELAEYTHQTRWAGAARASMALIAGYRGDRATSDALTDRVERDITASGYTSLLAFVQVARGAAALSRGSYREAFDHLSRLFQPGDPAQHLSVQCWAIGDLAEAAAHCDEQIAASRLLGHLTSTPATEASELVTIGLAYARPLLVEERSAEPLFRKALETGVSALPFLRARTQLSYGMWLRRQRRPREARGQLRLASAMFDILQAASWADRARQELRATGETLRPRGAQPIEELSPQERQIAVLAAEGLTNREIGQQLFISHRTVGSHLYRIFPKLGVSSRLELHSAIGEVAPESAAASLEFGPHFPDENLSRL